MAIKVFNEDIIEAEFVKRPNRFVIQCKLGTDTVSAYLPNPGRLRELLLPGVIIYLIKHNSGSVRFKAVATLNGTDPVLLDTHINNLVARRLMEIELIRGLEGFESLRPEVKVGGSRFDFLLTKGREQHCIEVKSCNLFGRDIAMFPDAPTERGRKHLEELVSLSKRGYQCHVLLLVHSPLVRYFLPDYHTDLAFAQAFIDAYDVIDVRAIGLKWTRDLRLSEDVRELSIPIGLLHKEAEDRGGYIVVSRLNDSREIVVGSLGRMVFPNGYYAYVGSAMKALTSRINRHSRQRKRLFWHIDYLLEDAQYIDSFAVRASERIECLIAEKMSDISDWTIKGFGCSDCSCYSHLFGFTENPLNNRAFIERLIWLRMDRLEERL